MRADFRAIIILIVFINLYACLAGYLLLRAARRVFVKRFAALEKIPLWIYWPLSLALSALYLYSCYFSRGMGSFFRLASSYWAFLLFTPFFILADFSDLGAFIFRACRNFRFRSASRAGEQAADAPSSKKSGTVFSFAVRLTAFVLALLTIALGALSARYAKVVDYTVAVEKPLPQNGLRIALVSDIHIGAMVHKKQLRRLVSKINALEADLILIPGDIIDRNLDVYKSENLNEEIGDLEARLGVYAAPGNHDYFGGDLGELEDLLAAGGVRLLTDDAALVADAFYVIGMNDFSAGRRGAVRKPLAEVTGNLDTSLPLILMDHQPQNLGEAEAAGIDLQVSGHTHRGQIWPGPLVTKRLYELDYGFLRKGKTAFVVSSGSGTWGPPVRIGTRSEIVCIDLKNPPDYNAKSN